MSDNFDIGEAVKNHRRRTGTDDELGLAAAVEDVLSRFCESVLVGNGDGRQAIEGVNQGVLRLRVTAEFDQGGIASILVAAIRKDGETRHLTDVTFSREGDAVH